MLPVIGTYKRGGQNCIGKTNIFHHPILSRKSPFSCFTKLLNETANISFFVPVSLSEKQVIAGQGTHRTGESGLEGPRGGAKCTPHRALLRASATPAVAVPGSSPSLPQDRRVGGRRLGCGVAARGRRGARSQAHLRVLRGMGETCRQAPRPDPPHAWRASSCPCCRWLLRCACVAPRHGAHLG
jgi:hypothetical protein